MNEERNKGRSSAAGFEGKLDQVLARHNLLSDRLAAAAPLSPKDLARFSKEYSELSGVVARIEEWKGACDEIADLAEMIADAAEDDEVRQMAEEEFAALRARIPELERAIKLTLLPKDEADQRNAILEVRAGTGGEEAALFAADLFRMYQRYADLHNWKFEIMEISGTDKGGFKEAVANITGADVFARLKFESGVHRVQRVPQTETQGRIHTSAATVAVLPEAEEVDVEINDADIRVDRFHSGGAGGQHVNKVETGIRITHLPTNIAVTCTGERSQLKNRLKAMGVLRARILDMKIREQEAEIAGARKAQVGTGGRSEKIRTYNFPQDRVTDHRIGITMHNLPSLLDGKIDDLIDAVATSEEAKLLEEQTAI